MFYLDFAKIFDFPFAFLFHSHSPPPTLTHTPQEAHRHGLPASTATFDNTTPTPITAAAVQQSRGICSGPTSKLPRLSPSPKNLQISLNCGDDDDDGGGHR